MKGRLTEPKWVCLTCDPALVRAVDFEALRQYKLGRDITALPVDVDKHIETETGEPVAMFKVKPLDRKSSLILSEGEAWAETEIVRTHVLEVHNYEGVTTEYDKEQARACLTKDSMEQMDDETITELAEYLRDAARGADGSAGRPFSLPDTWRGDRLRSLALSVNRAVADKTAK